MAHTSTHALRFPVLPRAPRSLRSGPASSATPHVAGLRFALPQSAPADVHVLDPEGHRVRTLVSGELAAGEHTCGWDGRNEAGHRCAPGSYVLRLESAGRLLTSRIVALS